MNTCGEGLEDCLHRFGSVRPDFGGPIRLQNASTWCHTFEFMSHQIDLSSWILQLWIPFEGYFDRREGFLLVKPEKGASALDIVWTDPTRDVTYISHFWDPKRYRQSPRPSLRMFILKELNAAVGAVWLVRLATASLARLLTWYALVFVGDIFLVYELTTLATYPMNIRL
jgi:hypothetical protein